MRYHADGLTGLADRRRPGRRSRLTEAPRCEGAKWGEDGPARKIDGGGAGAGPTCVTAAPPNSMFDGPSAASASG